MCKKSLMDLFAWWWLISLSKNSAKLMLKTIKAWKNPLGTYSKMTKFSFMRNFELSQGGSGQQVWWIFETLRCTTHKWFFNGINLFSILFFDSIHDYIWPKRAKGRDEIENIFLPSSNRRKDFHPQNSESRSAIEFHIAVL